MNSLLLKLVDSTQSTCTNGVCHGVNKMVTDAYKQLSNSVTCLNLRIGRSVDKKVLSISIFQIIRTEQVAFI